MGYRNENISVNCKIFHRSHILQADSEEMYHAWIDAMQKGIGAAFQRTMSSGDGVGKGTQSSSPRSQSAMQLERSTPFKAANSGTNHMSLMPSQPQKPKRTRYTKSNYY